MNEQLQQLQGQLVQLKAALFDANNQIGQMTSFQQQFFGILADTLALPEESRNDPDAYLNAVRQLVEQQQPQPTETPVAEPVAVEQQPDPVVHSLLAG